jgi:hypothetical protein
MANDTGNPSAQLGAGERPSVFYLRSAADNKDWVLAVKDNGYDVQVQHLSGAPSQLWYLEDDVRGGYFLRNIRNDKVLMYTGGQGDKVVVVDKNLALTAQLWRDDWQGAWDCITAYNNWQQKVNVAGGPGYDESRAIVLWEYSGGAPNEIWQFQADSGLMKVESITYDMSQAKLNLAIPPSVCAATAVDNRAGTTAMDTTVELSRTISNSRQFSYSQSSSTTFKIAEKLGSKLGIEKIVEVSGEIAVERSTTDSVTLGQQSSQTFTASDKVAVRVQVPPKSQFEYMIRVYYGSVSVPYTATVSRMTPAGKVTEQVTGIFTDVNMVKYDIQATDVSGAMPKMAGALAAPSGVREPEFEPG